MRGPTRPTDWDNGQQPFYILTVNWGGRAYRFSTYPITLTSTEHTGGLLFNGGLDDPDLTEEADRHSTSAGGISVPVSVVFPGVNVAEQIAAKHFLSAATAEIAMITVDTQGDPVQSYDDRWVLISGRIVQPVYGWPGQPGRADFSIEQPAPEDVTTLISDQSKITAITWPDADEGILGRVYPTIIGSPGSYFYPMDEAANINKIAYVQGSPAYKIKTVHRVSVFLLIAGHPVIASHVQVYDDSGNTAKVPVINQQDGLGRSVAVVDINGSGLTTTDTKFFCDWRYGGGLANVAGDGALTALGDVCIWAFTKGTQGVDIAKWVAERPALNRVLIDCYINDPQIRPWEWVRSNLLELLPIAIRNGNSGVFPRVRLFGMRGTIDTVASITEGPTFTAVGPITTQTELGDIRNTISLRYAPNATESMDYRRAVTISSDPGEDTITTTKAFTKDPNEYSSAYSVFSQSRYGLRAETLESKVIYDTASAGLILTERLRAKGFMERTQPFTCATHWGWLAVGDFISLTSSETGMSNAVAEITSKTFTGSGWDLVLTYDDDPLMGGS